MNIYDQLVERGYIAQCTNEEGLRKLLSEEQVSFYIGIDATADSLHAGHFLTLVVMKRLQEAGHRPIVLIGGGTTLIGDPTGRDEMRNIQSVEDIKEKAEKIRQQASRFLDFSEGKALMVNNADWLSHLNYISFLRDYGPHFSINRMINMESYQSRLDKGLTLLEFNYMPMQAYDFLHLYRELGCRVQMGGSDQWSNIIGGIDLIRKLEGQEAFGLTFNLITTSSGEKMGKTVKGALWLDPEKTSAHEFFQYWRNVEDESVDTLLKRYTFLSLEKIEELTSEEGAALNKAKEVLAYELTKMVHGEEEASRALASAKSLFGSGGEAELPAIDLSRDRIGQEWLSVLCDLGIVSSRNDGRRLMQQNGLLLNGERLTDISATLSEEDFPSGEALVRRGKKMYTKIKLVD
ncbi:MAG: tyrosine--tRNA ligase [Tissierellia bacterium]|nr:tyrosine--tRNA ligase [Bacillota bacterium]NLL23788.1 tyrosine--tRNA ligase [Tissierellia bacterium]